MTRHSPSEAALGEIPVSGLHANFTLLSAFNDAVGKEVLLELVDGSVFTGIFGGASSEMEVGLYMAYEKTPDNEKNLLPLKKDLVHKRQFAFSDIVCVTVPTNDEKLIRGFATDRDYHNKRRVFDDEDELEAWEGDGDDVDLESDEAVKAAATRNATRNGGWGVNEMFAANQTLGVKTTFEDNLSQYTTAEVEGTEEDRRRADEIARQIEKSGSSRMYSALENDDEERDLDKITDETELLGGYETKNKNWSNGSSTAPALLIPTLPTFTGLKLTKKESNGSNGNDAQSTPISDFCRPLEPSPPRPPSLMTSAPPGFPNTPPGGFNSINSITAGGFTPVISGRGRKGHGGGGGGGTPSDQSHNTYLPLVNRGVNNNGRGGNQKTPQNDRAALLKGPDPRQRTTNSGGMPVRGGGPLPSPKGGQGAYVKRDSYDGSSGGGQNYDNWNPKGGMKTYENTKMKESARDQKMMLENRNSAANSPRNAGGPPTGPPTSHTAKGGTSGRVEGLKAWQQDMNISYTRENKPMQKGPGEKTELQPVSTPLVESTPPTKNAWQSGPPSGLTSSSRSDESKSATTVPSPSLPAPTPAEMKMAEEKEAKEEAGASTSHEGERREETTGEEKKEKEDADMSKDSCGKKFSFNPDAPVFTPKTTFPGAAGGMGGGLAAIPTLPQPPMVMPMQPMQPTMMAGGQMPIQAQMGGMGGMQQPAMIYSYPTHSQYPNMQQNMQYSAVVNGGAIMAGAAQNGGQTGGAPSTPRGTNGGQGGGMGGGPRGGAGGGGQRPGGVQGAATGGGPVPVTMPGGAMYMTQGGYQPLPQQGYMQPQPTYYPYPSGQLQGTYAMQMPMQQQAMMAQPQRAYVPQATHPGMMMQYNVQQQYGGGPPPGVNTQQGGVQGGQGGQGATPSASTTNGGPPSNGNTSGGGQGGAPNVHPPSQPPTPGAAPPSSQTGGVPSQTGMMPPPQGLSQGGPPGMAPPPVPSPGMYGMPYGQAAPMVYYNQGGAPMGGMEMHGGGGEGAEGMHQMHPYQYNAGQYYQSAPPHLRAAYQQPMNHGMQPQQQHVPAQPSQSQN